MATSPLEIFFNPQSIAIIGATEDSTKFGNAVTINLLQNANLPVKLYPVSRSSNQVCGIAAYPSIKEIPDPIDLAIILVPAKSVPTVVDECINKPVKGIIIVTAGFGELNQEGKKIEQSIARKCKTAAIRVIGPNCVGIENSDIGMNASFIQLALPGNISMVSQSGSFGCAIIDGLKWQNLGISKFANIGNAIDVSFDDILYYFKDDPHTSVIAVYLESLTDGRSFYNVLRNITPIKPVVVIKGGRTAVGMAAAGSHTGSIATNYRVLKIAVEQAGGIICDNMNDYITALKTFSYFSLPRGDHIGVLTNSGGTGVLLSDNLEENGLPLASFTPQLIAKITPFVIPIVQKVNPLDMIAGANETSYYQITKTMLETDSELDLVIACGVYPPFLGIRFHDNYRGMIQAWIDTQKQKPLLPLLIFGTGYQEIVQFAREHHVTFFSTPQEAALGARLLINRFHFFQSRNKMQ